MRESLFHDVSHNIFNNQDIGSCVCQKPNGTESALNGHVIEGCLLTPALLFFSHVDMKRYYFRSLIKGQSTCFIVGMLLILGCAIGN